MQPEGEFVTDHLHGRIGELQEQHYNCAENVAPKKIDKTKPKRAQNTATKEAKQTKNGTKEPN